MKKILCIFPSFNNGSVSFHKQEDSDLHCQGIPQCVYKLYYECFLKRLTTTTNANVYLLNSPLPRPLNPPLPLGGPPETTESKSAIKSLQRICLHFGVISTMKYTCK